MRTLVGILVTSAVLAACATGQTISREEAERTAAHGYTSMRDIDQRSGKLMTWEEWKAIGLAGHGEPGPTLSAGQLVWAVALHDRETADAVVVILNAMTGSQIMVSGGPWRWPPYWGQLPDRTN